MSTLAAGGLRQRPGLLLGAFALGCSALLGAGDLATRTEIRLRQAEDLRHALDQTLASVPHDNNPASDQRIPRGIERWGSLVSSAAVEMASKPM